MDENFEGKPIEVFVNSCGKFLPEHQNSDYPMHANARFLDVEHGNNETTVNNNTRMVVLSYKTEFSGANNFQINGGGMLELFGAKHLVVNEPGTYFINNVNSHVSMAASMPKENNRGQRKYEIREVRGSEERFFTVPQGRSVGLYTGYRIEPGK